MIVKNTFLSFAILSNVLLVFSPRYVGKRCLCVGEWVLCSTEGWALCGARPEGALCVGSVWGGRGCSRRLGRSLLCRASLLRDKTSCLCPRRVKCVSQYPLELWFWRRAPFPASSQCAAVSGLAIPQVGLTLVLCRNKAG